jgi:DNA-directed RNA polymerase subunit K/omega
MKADKDKLNETNVDETKDKEQLVEAEPLLDSKYRLIIITAQRSKQLKKGTSARVEIGGQRRIKALRKPSSIGLERIRSAVQDVSQRNES